jgi:hypothetical protein
MSFNPTKDIPDLSSKVFFITGGKLTSLLIIYSSSTSNPADISQGTNGLGKQTILDLLPHSPSHIFFTGRNVQSAESLIKDHSSSPTKLTFIACDQQSLHSVAQATPDVSVSIYRSLYEEHISSLQFGLSSFNFMSIPLPIALE